MTIPDNIRKIYFLGIGGIGMSALARYFMAKGAVIHGYDRTSTALTDSLIREGMSIHFEDDPSEIPAGIDLVIYTPAVPQSLKEFINLKESGIPMFKRAEVTGWITRGKLTVAVAGTHGKTSISSMIAHILKEAGLPVTALIGGISKNYNSNFITAGRDDIMLVEADEYDRSFLHLEPDIAVISAIDPDHLDIYGTVSEVKHSFNQFARNIKPGGKLVIRKGIDVEMNEDTRRIDYASEETSYLIATDLKTENGIQYFDAKLGDISIGKIKIQIPGRHNVENSLAAMAVCFELGVNRKKIIGGIGSYTGVRRRFDVRIRNSNQVFIDDYAHHPAELEAFITAVRQLYPDKKITGLFQPHLYSRTRDFAEGFARSLDLLDEIWLLDIYPAREMPIEGVTSHIIFDLIRQPNKKILSRDEVLTLITRQKPSVFLTMGAGDIDLLVDPIENILRR